MKRFLPLLIILPLLIWVACEESEDTSPELIEDCAGVLGGNNVCGCTDSTSTSYDSTATFDDGSCEDCTGVSGGDNICGCSDSNASNYDSEATYDDGSCQYIFFKTYDGSDTDYGKSVQQTLDGGYIVVGSAGIDGVGANVLLIKTDLNGNEEWNRTFGGNGYDYGEYVQQTTDGGYIIFATTTNSFAENGLWLIKTDLNGNEEWNNLFAYGSEAYSGQQTSDGGYIITGNIIVNGYDALLIKTDSEGNEEWHKIFAIAEDGTDTGRSVKQTSDGGYIITGYTSVNAYLDAFLIKTDLNGNEEWNRTFGGNGYDRGESVQQTIDGGYIIFGESDNNPVLIKTDSQGQEEWSEILEGSIAWSGQQTIDGGYIVTGSAGTAIGAFLIKTDSNGSEVWRRIFGGLGVNGDHGRSVQQTSDGGYVITGDTNSFGDGYIPDIWLIKTDSEGNTTDNP